MNVGLVLAELREKQVKISADGDRLRCDAPAGTLTPELRALLSEHKAALLEFLSSAQQPVQEQEGLIPLQAHGNSPPIFAVPGHSGDVFCYRALAQHLGSQQPFYGLKPPGLYGEDTPVSKVEEMASYFAKQIRQITTQPIIIAGYCAGGSVAFELARQLQEGDASVLLVALFGSPYPTFFRSHNRIKRRVLNALSWDGPDGFRAVAQRFALRTKRRLLKLFGSQVPESDEDLVLARRDVVAQTTVAAAGHYKPSTFAGRIALLLPSSEWAGARFRARLWSKHADSCEEYVGPKGCDGDNMLLEPNVVTFSAMFVRAIENASSNPGAATSQSLRARESAVPPIDEAVPRLVPE